MPTPGFTGQLSPARQQFFDSVGRPLAGGRVFHYLPGTTTPATTYADPDFTIPNQNPVPLDAAGRASIYADRTLRQVLKNSAGATIWDAVTVTGIGSNSSSALSLDNIAALRANTTPYPLFYVESYYAAGDGSDGFFLWDQADTTSVDNNGTIIVDAGGRRYKRQGITSWIDVRWFGAKGDGVTVDTTAIQGAINYAQTRNLCVVYFSPGDYVTNAQINITGFGLNLIGGGWDSIIRGIGNFDTFRFYGSVQGQGIRGLTFQSDQKTGGYDVHAFQSFKFSYIDCIHFNSYQVMFLGHSNTTNINYVWAGGVRGPRAFLFQGTNSGSCGGVHMDRVIVGVSLTGSTGTTAFEMDGYVATVTMHSVHMIGGAAGASKMTHGIWSHNAIGATNTLRFLYGNDVQMDFPEYIGLNLEYCAGGNLSALYVSASERDSNVYLGEDVRDFAINGCTIASAAKHGIEVWGRNIIISDGTVNNNSYPSSIGNNQAQYDGIYVGATALDVSISACRIGNTANLGQTQRYGVYGAAGARNITVSGCMLANNVLGPYRDDTAVATGNMSVAACAGLNSTFEANTIIGAQGGFRGRLAPVIGGGGAISSVTVVDAGYHYEVAPSVFPYDPDGTGSGATFKADVANGKITSVTVNTSGANYGPNTVIYILPANDQPALRALNPLVVNANLKVRAQSAGRVQIGTDQGSGLEVNTVANAVNFVQITGSASGSDPFITAAGADANIDLRLIPKGTGLINFGVYTAGVPVTTGYITMKTQAGQTVQIPVRLV